MEPKRPQWGFSKRPKRRDSTSPTTSRSDSFHRSEPELVFDDSGDKRNAVREYIKASSLLEEELKRRRRESDSFGLPDLELEEDGFSDLRIRDKINKALEARRDSVKDPTAWAKLRHVLYCMIVALTPVAKHIQELPIREPVRAIPQCFPSVYAWRRYQIEIRMGSSVEVSSCCLRYSILTSF